MGSYEIIVKTEELRRKAQESDYLSAQRILDTIDLKKVKNTSDLSLMVEVFIQNERYDDAFMLLERIYSKSKTRKILYQLVWTSIQRFSAKEAEHYLKEYELFAPKDFYKYIFRYSIDKMNGAPYEVLIDTLRTLKETEYIEQWAYELAKLYYKAGMEEECIRECSDIILWFGEGSYVEKAKLLKAYYSGEADKDMIIEELRKRASKESRGDVESQQEEVEVLAQEETTEGIKEEPKEISKEEIWDENELLQKESIEETVILEFSQAIDTVMEDELADSRKREVEVILSEDLMVQEPITQRELAEQEVEEEIYRLLDEEDEDSRRLKLLSEELHLDFDDIFGNFLHVKAVRKQLVKSLDMILDRHAKSVQMIITGTSGSGKTTLAKDLSVFLYKIGKIKTPRVAKISAEKLNSIDLMDKKDTLKHCCIIIENASELKRPSIDKILELIQCLRGEVAIIFEENKKNMNQLFRECPKLMDLFKNRIHLPGYTEEEYLGFAYFGIKRGDYKLAEGAQLVLRNAVNKITKKSEEEKKLQLIEKLIQDTMDASDIRIGKKLSELAATGRLGDADILTILPEDFNT